MATLSGQSRPGSENPRPREEQKKRKKKKKIQRLHNLVKPATPKVYVRRMGEEEKSSHPRLESRRIRCRESSHVTLFYSHRCRTFRRRRRVVGADMPDAVWQPHALADAGHGESGPARLGHVARGAHAGIGTRSTTSISTISTPLAPSLSRHPRCIRDPN